MTGMKKPIMYKLTTYIPTDYLEAVKQALFDAGAGQIGNYQYCCWQVLGTGQFMPLAGNHAFIGTTNQLQTIEEWRVEMVVVDARIKAVVQALKQAHPYETPAYDVLKLEDF